METNSFYRRLGDNAQPIREAAIGASGYFSSPADHLDPNLFIGDHIIFDVRKWLLNTLYEFWGTRYNGAGQWSEVWLAGSGISYQWAADRGNGDLDVLIGVDFSAFGWYNPDYAGMTSQEIADLFDEELKAELWPDIATTQIGDRVYEVTYYVNPNSREIKNINPYAAYSLTRDEWTVRPPELPANPRDLYSDDFKDAADRDTTEAHRLVTAYNATAEEMQHSPQGGGHWVTLGSQLKTIVAQAAQLFDDIHLGRRAAFAPGGSGYGDFANYRWQAAKESGAVEMLRSIKDVQVATHHQVERDAWGQPISDAQLALRNAALWRSR
ncbi:hypothetical protein ACJ6WD_11235 [Streptomyces sp. VTCC 41912]|uniref:hypothetical protein n=1 Tax=Streptomyces sp. VTCC 41912 TaxID=3383243 RepID=UPI003896C185